MTYWNDDDDKNDEEPHDPGPRIYECEICGVDCVLVEDRSRSHLMAAAVLEDGKLWCEECWYFTDPDKRPEAKGATPAK